MGKVEAATKTIRGLAEGAGPGGRLPTFRVLMADLGLSQATVAAALRRLEGEGVVERRPGSGLFATADVGRRPVLLVCDSASFVGASPFWEIMMEGLLAPYEAHPEGLCVEFTTPSLAPRGAQPLDRLLTEATWTRLRARAFSAAILVCPDERLGWAIERLGVPVVGFGCPAHAMIRTATLEACNLGVSELVRLGCRRIALYNAPHIDAKEVFVGALSAHGASECVVPPTVAFRPTPPQLGHRYRLVEGGLHEATRLFGPGSDAASRPDGVLSVDDMFTQGFLMGLHRHGLCPGRDVQVATHVNRGSPSLVAWKDEIVGLEFNVREVANALNSAAAALARGETPNRDGWEQSALMQEREGPLRTLTLRPTVRRPKKPVPT